MKRFALLINLLDQTNKTNEKVALLVSYFKEATDKDKVWALALFTGRRPKRQVNTTLLRSWVTTIANIPDWLFEESYHVIGDLAETISLILPTAGKTSDKTLNDWLEYLKSLENLSEPEKKEKILEAYEQLDKTGRFVFSKLITGGWRIGVSQKLIIRALSQIYDIDPAIITFRLTGNWDPFLISYHDLIVSENKKEDHSKPYPFYLAYPLDAEPDSLGTPEDWQAEWKWDGIRGQLILRNNSLHVWTRGEELVTDKYPEFSNLTGRIPDGTVLDGEILAFKNDKVLPFSFLQKRIGRKTTSAKLLREVPVVFYAFDIIEWDHEDIRDWPQIERRKKLTELIDTMDSISSVWLPEPIRFHTWEELGEIRKKSREFKTEGLMLKRKSSPYETGRKKGNWWKWKIEPFTIDGVMIYAQKGHGRRADLFSDYTLAIWDKNQLVPFAKAYSGLTDNEMMEVDRFVKRNTIERFGPVRTVKPELVFEIAFEGIQPSKRHKSGIALRFPRINRWRKDKKPEDANTLSDLEAILKLTHSE